MSNLYVRKSTWSGLLLAVLLSIAKIASGDDVIPWAADYRQAAELAARDHKLVLLHFWSDDCPPCRKLEANVFPKPEVAAAIGASYIPVKVHVDRAPELARRYQVTRWPTDVIVTPTGLEVYRTVSPQEPARYAAMLIETAAKAGAPVAQADASRAPLPSPRSASPAQPVGFEGPAKSKEATKPSADFQPPIIERGTPHDPRAAQSSVAGVSGLHQDGPYHNGSRGAASNASPAAAIPASPYSSEFAPEVGGPTVAGHQAMAHAAEYGASPRPASVVAPASAGNQVPAAAPSEKESNSGSHASAFQGGPAGMQENQFLHAEKQEPAPIVSSTPDSGVGGTPPLGMEGYCTVTLADEVKWKKGDKRFGAFHRGRLYLFTSADAQKKFLAEPDKYGPALSGYDPVRFAECGQLVDGKRAHGLRYNNQVYLFADEESLKKFQASPRPAAETAYQAMLRSDSGKKLR